MDPPTLDNTRGKVIYIATGCTLALVTIVVFLRLWGRYRFSNATTDSFRLYFGGHHLWVFLSDIAILLSFIMATVLTVVACVGVRWGLGIHTKLLSAHQAGNALEMFYLYQVFYKFAAASLSLAYPGGCSITLHTSANGTVTGITVSQLEVNFGIMSACIPTVLKILEDSLNSFLHCAFGRERTKTETQSRSLKSGVQLSVIDKTVPRKKYTRFWEDEENDLGSVHSGNSTANIITKDKNRIKVETSFLVEESTPNDNNERASGLGVKTQTSVHAKTEPKPQN
ncbi:hypothetical protein B7463_g11609, partial [Scytalidium lignicola]